MEAGRQSRVARTEMSPGEVYTLASLELLHNLKLRLKNSEGNQDGGNQEPIFCIPILLSCIRILALEIENLKQRLKKYHYQSELIPKLKTNKKNDIVEILEFYKANEDLKKDFDILIEIRNEIIHPSPFSEEGFTLPSYLEILKDKEIIWMPDAEQNVACNIYWHFRCHKLFEWSFERFCHLSKYVIESEPCNVNHMEIYKDNFYSKD